MKTKKILLNVLPLLLIGGAMVYAAAPLGGYMPGATTDPDCAPGDTDCFVSLPADSDDQTLSLSGTNLEIEDGNTIDLMGIDTTIWSQTGSTAYYNTGSVGIGTDSPERTFHVDSTSFNSAKISRDNPLPGKGTMLEFEDSDGDAWSIGSTTTNVAVEDEFLIRGPSGNDRITIDDVTGNVGIGTITPESRLSISGLPSGATDAVVTGSLEGAVCITTGGNMYIDTDGSCAN